MGQSTNLYTQIRFAGKTYNSKEEVTEDLQTVNEIISNHRSKLMTLAFMTEPKKFCPEDESVEYYLKNQVDEIVDELDDLYVQRYKLELLEQHWYSCHTIEGLGVNPPEEIKYKHYIDGDFVHTVKYPDDESFFK